MQLLMCISCTNQKRNQIDSLMLFAGRGKKHWLFREKIWGSLVYLGEKGKGERFSFFIFFLKKKR